MTNYVSANESGETLGNGATIHYRRLRAPRAHGESLQAPPLETINTASSIWTQNLGIDKSNADLHFNHFGDLSNSARSELVAAAQTYSQVFRDIAFVKGRSPQIVMSGHQPHLFHPGVWFKNFALSQLGQRLNAVPINIVVDNDICGVPAIRVPRMDGIKAAQTMVALDDRGDNIPYEARTIKNQEVFDRAGDKLVTAIKPFCERPIAERLWPLICHAENDPRLGLRMAQGRFRLEAELGLETLEIPLSQIAMLPSFAKFSKEILVRLEDFSKHYNQSLDDYRAVHKIRSRSHPVPSLEHDDDWFEAPYWIWTAENPIRRRLFVRRSGEHIHLSDRQKVNFQFDIENFSASFTELSSKGVIVRPRALITTMFARTVLSDLFLHGIGGAKYDQLTDAIIARFFGIQAPEFVTLSATLKLPNRGDDVSKEDWIRAKRRERELAFNGEKFVSDKSPEVQTIITEKRRWISANAPEVSRRERHFTIKRLNEKLQPFLHEQKIELEQTQRALRKQIKNAAILGSREYSFALHDDSMIESLSRMALHSESLSDATSTG